MGRKLKVSLASCSNDADNTILYVTCHDWYGQFLWSCPDTYNRFLKRSERKRWIVFIHDFLFWVIQGLLIFYVLFLVNEGEFRFYLFLALLCGFSAYQALLKSLYRSSLELFIKIVIKIFEF